MKKLVKTAWAWIEWAALAAWGRLTWGNVLAVVNPRFDLKTAYVVTGIAAALVAAALAAGLVLRLWDLVGTYPWATAVCVATAIVLKTAHWGRRAGAARVEAEAELARLRADFANRVATEVALQVQQLVTANTLLQQERDDAITARTAAEDKLAEQTDRLDLSGQFVALCVRWWVAKRSKKAAPMVAGKALDADYWWKQLEAVAKKRWPGYSWQPDELLAAAQEVAEGIDLARWRRVVNSQFGLTLTV